MIKITDIRSVVNDKVYFRVTNQIFTFLVESKTRNFKSVDGPQIKNTNTGHYNNELEILLLSEDVYIRTFSLNIEIVIN